MAEVPRSHVATAAGLAIQPATADCVTDAAKCHFAIESIPRAILWTQFQMNPGTVNRNLIGTVAGETVLVNRMHR